MENRVYAVLVFTKSFWFFSSFVEKANQQCRCRCGAILFGGEKPKQKTDGDPRAKRNALTPGNLDWRDPEKRKRSWEENLVAALAQWTCDWAVVRELPWSDDVKGALNTVVYQIQLTIGLWTLNKGHEITRKAWPTVKAKKLQGLDKKECFGDGCYNIRIDERRETFSLEDWIVLL